MDNKISINTFFGIFIQKARSIFPLKWGTFALLFVLAAVLIGEPLRAQKKYYNLQERIEAEEYFLKGMHHYNNMEYTSAIEFFRKSLGAMPLNERVRYWLGKTYLMAGYKALAISEWENLVRFNAADILLRQKLQELYTESFINPKANLNGTYVFLKYLYAGAGITALDNDNDNNLYISNFASGNIEVRDSNFQPLKKFSSSIEKPMDIDLNSKYLAVASFGNDRVILFNKKSSAKTFEIGSFGIKEGQMSGPSGIDLAEDRLYVADSGNNRVQVFRVDPKPSFLLMFGKKGKKPGEFFSPSDVAYFQGKIWVADTGNRRIQIFDESGNYLSQFGNDFLEKPRKILIKGKRLYIVDENKGLLLYNLQSKKFKVIKGLNQNSQKPLGVSFDKNGVLYMGDFFTNKITAYIPDKMKLSALKLESLLTLNVGFPKIAIKLRVQDIKGRDVPGLKSNNFQIFQEGKKIKELNVFPLKPDGEKISTIILHRNSKNMKRYQSELSSYFQKTFKQLRFGDRVQLINYNNIFTTAQAFTGKPLQVIEAFRKTKYTNTKSDIMDAALYQGITKNLSNDYYNSIVLIEDGKTRSAFQKYSLEVIAHYAKRNGIPIFIVAMDEGALTPHLKYLAEESGGAYLHFFKSNRIYNLVKSLRTKRPLFYVLTYSSPNYSPINKNHWLNVLIELKYKNLYGAEKTGYFIP